MDISVIMIDGQFREHTFGADYFSRQDYDPHKFEVIWVEFYSKVPPSVRENKRVKVITLGNPEGTMYHSSFCFNRGITEAKGELLVIPDADQIVRPDFLKRLWEKHEAYDKLVIYPHRYDEVKRGDLNDHSFEELERKCRLKNPLNYGGCLSVRKKWMMEINGYEQHRIMESGFHANGADVYTRFKNLGLAVMWANDLRLYHPWHANTLVNADEYKIQNELIQWRFRNLEYLAINGISPGKNSKRFNEEEFMRNFNAKRDSERQSKTVRGKSFLSRMFGKSN